MSEEPFEVVGETTAETDDAGDVKLAGGSWTALVIPVEGPLRELELPAGDSLAVLQEAVGGMIEAVPLPSIIAGASRATAYVNEEGKYTEGCDPNMRATDYLVPGVGLFFGDWVAGPMVLAGFDPETGEHAELPIGVIRRARLIEREAG